MRIKLISAVAIFLGGASLFAQQPPRSELTVAEFEKLHKDLEPPQDELWRTIPWHVSIVEAQHAAAKTKKPIFVWVASGEPLGCG
jgi:regulator of protease activity HflC (stomatin/prohibitin superfamily)